MSSTRPAVTVYDEDTSMTFLKPLSDEYRGSLIMVLEDAYGDLTSELISVQELKEKNIDKDELNEILNLLK